MKLSTLSSQKSKQQAKKDVRKLSSEKSINIIFCVMWIYL